jgi:hypothetical protein
MFAAMLGAIAPAAAQASTVHEAAVVQAGAATPSTDISARHRGRAHAHRHARRYAHRHHRFGPRTGSYAPHYYARPYHYRPYAPAPFFPFGFGGYGFQPSW